MWDEKPGLLNMTATACIFKSVVWTNSGADAMGKAAAVGGADCEQQFIGHFSELAVDATVFPASVPVACAVISWQ